MRDNYDVTQPEIDRSDKAIMRLALDVLGQGQGNASELYEIMEEHFMLKSKWKYRNFDEPTYTKAEVEQLIEAIAAKVDGLKTHVGNDSIQCCRFGAKVNLDEVLEAIRSTKL